MSPHVGAGLPKADARLLERHVAALLDAHPWLETEWNRAGTSRMAGCLPMELPDGRIEPVVIAVEVTAARGQVHAVAFDPERRWPAHPDRHVVSDHQFCLGLRNVDEPVIRSPADLLRWMADVVVFVRQQLIMEATLGGFPGREWPHGERQAYSLHIIERLSAFPDHARPHHWDCLRGVAAWPLRNDPCSCGSGRKFKKCCLLAAKSELARLVQQADLESLEYEDLREVVRTRAA
jgi:hypothetical protein